MYIMETELIQVSGNCAIAIPYWNWSLDPDPENSIIFRAEYMGSSNRVTQGCVTDGHFGTWGQHTNNRQTNWRNPQGGIDYSGCITRGWNRGTPPVTGGFTDPSTFGQHTTYQTWGAALEEVHSDVHCAIGGHMCIDMSEQNTGADLLVGLSSFDPIFWTLTHMSIIYGS